MSSGCGEWDVQFCLFPPPAAPTLVPMGFGVSRDTLELHRRQSRHCPAGPGRLLSQTRRQAGPGQGIGSITGPSLLCCCHWGTLSGSCNALSLSRVAESGGNLRLSCLLSVECWDVHAVFPKS